MKKELIDLLSIRTESKNIDYKRAELWETCKIGLTKDILAMTNIKDGGTIVIGVEEDKTTGELKCLGFQNENLMKDYDITKISDFVNKYANPEVNIKILKEELEGKKYIFINIKEFENIPVVCKKDFLDERGKKLLGIGVVYVRTNSGKSVPITSQEIDSVAEMRKLLDITLTKQKEELLEKIRRIVGTQPIYEIPVDQLYQNERQGIIKEFK